jgi:hypothetical protein
MMQNVTLVLEGALRVLVAGLIFGAGLPAIYALGIRAQAYGQGGDAEVDPQPPHPIGRVLGFVCFAIVLGGVVLGLAVIVAGGFGKQVSFEGIIPTIVDK